jgi:PAS domain S-box-containing protein
VDTQRFEHGIQASDLVKWALGITGGVLIIVGAFLLWNRSLAGRVRQRTRELESATENLEAEMAEKIRAEAALQESRNFTDKLIETANVMIVGLDVEGKVNVFNPAAEKITGYTLSELQGQDWFELLTPKERYPQVHAEFSRLMAGGIPKLFENPILTKTGDERVISWCNNEIAYGDQITGILSFGIEITDKKKAEQALAESEMRFRALMEQAPFSIQLFAPNGTLIQVNEAWQALWGIPDETLPELLGSYNPLEDEEARKMGLLPFIQKAFNGENVVLPFVEYDSASTLENMEIDGRGGHKSIVRARFYPVKNQNGDIVTVVSVEEDITESKQAEEKIQQYQQRLKALAAQLTLAEEQERRRIAADLHDHVGHSLALARMQLDGLQDSATELERNIIVKDISNIMLQALQETRSLIFALSSPLMNEIGLGAAIAEWLEEQVEKRYGIKTQFSDTIAKEHRKTLDENVRALLFRNVRELLTNVIKHSRATTVSVRLQESGSETQILIEDDGVGFDHDVLKNQSRSTNGFGLFSVQERMADLGGRCDILSAPGKGCRVILTVPLEKSDGVVEWWSGGVME